MPDRLRNDKSLFKSIVDEIGPDIEYAKSSAVEPLASVVSHEDVARVVREKLKGSAVDVFSADFLTHVLRSMQERRARHGLAARKLRGIIKKLTPARMRSGMRKVAAPDVDASVVAFRVYIVIRMHEMLSGDAKVFPGYTPIGAAEARAGERLT